MARPVKEPHEKRSVTFGTRFTTAERGFVEEQARAAGLDPAEYLRRRVLGHRVPPARGRADAMLLTELNRIGLELKAIGNNVNQIARAVNSDRPSRIDWDVLAERLEESRATVVTFLGKLEVDDDS
jgi:hypothetical protein